jgi:starch phosphorylase
MTPGKTKKSETPLDATTLTEDIRRHIQLSLGNDPMFPTRFSCYMGLAYSVRDRLLGAWIDTQRSLYDTLSKRVYYLSMEFLPGRFLKNYISSLQIEPQVRDALKAFGFELDDIEEEEWDAGLGNGGLGRLASCYMDSMATLRIPGYGYGIRYDFGIFHQVIEDGYQVEHCDNWMRRGSPWEIQRLETMMPVGYYGHSEAYTDMEGCIRYRWVPGETVMAKACDILVPGFGGGYVSNMRLWAAQSSREMNLTEFNMGDYVGAVENKVYSETISKVLYPSDEAESGKELRLKQQYFFVSATLQDIFRRFRKQRKSFQDLPDFVAIQLNDTHPAIAVPELMRLLLDEEGLKWDIAWEVCEKTFAYTNHTVLPEALETWPVDLIGRVLPRHLEIIYEINQRFLESVRADHPLETDLPARISLILEGRVRKVRMSHLAIVGSRSVNGVAALHTEILKEGYFSHFHRLYPDRIRNVTNGITPRRWLYQANPALSELITDNIGPDWVTRLDELERLVPLADDPEFISRWRAVKKHNKKRLARYILRKTGQGVIPDTLFDIHVKRMHEYKRQLLNLLHVVSLYRRIKENPGAQIVPRTVIFAGKAAPSYHMAKLIIKLINSVADVVNMDPDVDSRLKVIFLPNYCISQAEKVIPAADLSQQISTAGMEASGTGNMKFALNGALTIGTLDGANIEIRDAVGDENIFIFGLTAEEVNRQRQGGYNPREICQQDQELRDTLEMIGSGCFSNNSPELFTPILASLLDRGDHFMVLADYRSYLEAQAKVEALYMEPEAWTRKAILNTANMGYFSSDRAVLEYVERIWRVKPIEA